MAFENLNILSESEAKNWSNEVQRLNEETSDLLVKVGTALKEVQDDADSTVVDEIVKYGNQIVSGTRDILSGMNKLVEVVGGILGAVNKVLEEGKNIFKSVIGAITGFGD